MMIELTFAGDATGDSILNSGLVPPNRVLEVVKNGKGRLYSVSSRVLTVRQGEKTVTTAEDFDHEAKAGIIKVASLNEVQVE
jgi:hypothetical protein